jgi:hypothetical protein
MLGVGRMEGLAENDQLILDGVTKAAQALCAPPGEGWPQARAKDTRTPSAGLPHPS